MSLRFYVIPLVLRGEPPRGPYWEPDLPVGTSYAALVAPNVSYALCLVDAADHAAFAANVNNVGVPLAPSDSMNAVPNNGRNTYEARLRQAGYNVAIDWPNDTAGDLTLKMGRSVEPTFSRESMQVNGQGW